MKRVFRNEKGFSILEFLLVLVVVVLISVVGYLVYKDHHKNAVSNTSSTASSTKKAPTSTQTTQRVFQLPNGWNWYTNSQYGFRFAYPQSWGTPRFSESNGTTGASYSISLFPGPSYTSVDGSTSLSRNFLALDFDSDNYSFSSTNDAGVTGTGGPYATKTSILTALQQIQNGTYTTSDGNLPVIAHSSNSYATISTGSASDSTDYLEIDQIVALPTINVSGAFSQYYIADSGSCPLNRVASDSQQWCINQNVVDTVSQLTDSIQPL